MMCWLMKQMRINTELACRVDEIEKKRKKETIAAR